MRKETSLSLRMDAETRKKLDLIVALEDRTMTKVVERLIREHFRGLDIAPLAEWTPDMEADRVTLCKNLIAMSDTIEANRPEVFNQSDAERLRCAEAALTIMADIIARARA